MEKEKVVNEVNRSNLKLHAKTKEEKDEIQKELFRLGMDWISETNGSNTIHSIPHDDFIFAYLEPGKMYITCSRNEKHYNDHPATETTLEELKQMK